MKISAIVITKNEEPVIGDCLKSVDWVEEIVVLDGNSTDGTLSIAGRYCQTNINQQTGISFSDWRNEGAKIARGTWLFYIDADERCSPELASEIQAVTANTCSLPVAYDIPRANIRLTKPLFHGGWWPDYVRRLIRKDALVKWEGELHEQPVVKGEVGKLKAHLVHLSHRGSLEHKFNTTIKWSEIESEKLFVAGHPPMNLPRFLSALSREFWQRMIVRQGWRDGLEGVIEVIYQVFSVFITYARLWEMQIKEKK